MEELRSWHDNLTVGPCDAQHAVHHKKKSHAPEHHPCLSLWERPLTRKETKMDFELKVIAMRITRHDAH